MRVGGVVWAAGVALWVGLEAAAQAVDDVEQAPVDAGQAEPTVGAANGGPEPARADPAAPPDATAPAAPAAASASDTAAEPSGGSPLETAPAATPWRLLAHQYLRAEPTVRSARRGFAVKGSVLLVEETLDGDRTCAAGWGRLSAHGWLCLRWAEPAEPDAEPTPLPQLLAFDPPDPAEYWSYVETGSYERDAVVAPEDAVVPFVYGKAWRGWRAPVWRSLSTWERGRAREVEGLGADRKFAFEAAIETERGLVLRRQDGSVAPADQVFLYPISRFQGRMLADDPLPPGHLAGWARPYDGAPLYAQPSEDAEPVGLLAFQTPVDVRAEPATEDGGWLQVRGEVGDGAPRYARAADVAVYRPAPPPADLPPDALWVDIELEQQVLAVLVGDEPERITLVSSGRVAKARGTPTGLYRTTDKAAWGDMTSRDGADEEYHVEKVPWILHFWPRYALHGTFWHWGFGHQASHGCVNLSPRDAAWIFDRLGPTLPAGWHTAYAGDHNPGTVLRIRRGDDLDLRDRRELPAANQAQR